MSRSDYIYVPKVVGRRAELTALSDLGPDVKPWIKPVIHLPERTWNHKERKYTYTPEDHIKKFVARYFESWWKYPSWIRAENDTIGTDTVQGVHVSEFLYRKLLENGANTSLLVRLNDPHNLVDSLLQSANCRSSEMGILVTIEELMNDEFHNKLRKFVDQLKGRCLRFDLILDLRNPRYGGPFAMLVWERLYDKRVIDLIGRIVVVGTSVPQTFSSIAEGIGYLERGEWNFYRSLVTEYAGPSDVDVVFGDYGTVHPSFRLGGVVRNAFAKLCYTKKDQWVTLKRGRYHDDREQMRDICLDVLNDSQIEYPGRQFSKGDDLIFQCGTGRSTVGTLCDWKYASLNHHFTVVTEDLLELTDTSHRITGVSIQPDLFEHE